MGERFNKEANDRCRTRLERGLGKALLNGRLDEQAKGRTSHPPNNQLTLETFLKAWEAHTLLSRNVKEKKSQLKKILEEQTETQVMAQSAACAFVSVGGILNTSSD